MKILTSNNHNLSTNDQKSRSNSDNKSIKSDKTDRIYPNGERQHEQKRAKKH